MSPDRVKVLNFLIDFVKMKTYTIVIITGAEI